LLKIQEDTYWHIKGGENYYFRGVGENGCFYLNRYIDSCPRKNKEI
jgi:hypothetical protein